VLRDASPDAADRVAAGAGPAGLRTFTGRPGHLRRAWGPGWALVGDAGYWKDPISAHGLTDALRDAELLSSAVVAAVADPSDEVEALVDYQALRDRLSLPLFAVVDTIAGQRWGDDEIGGLLLRLSAAMAAEVDAIAALDPLPVP
jgi:2-polyprenyl-6-methoxyphenol hydroxylase-like FAD-dependent oxidoreductase